MYATSNSSTIKCPFGCTDTISDAPTDRSSLRRSDPHAHRTANDIAHGTSHVVSYGYAFGGSFGGANVEPNRTHCVSDGGSLGSSDALADRNSDARPLGQPHPRPFGPSHGITVALTNGETHTVANQIAVGHPHGCANLLTVGVSFVFPNVITNCTDSCAHACAIGYSHGSTNCSALVLLYPDSNTPCVL